MAATASRRGMLISTSPVGYPLIAKVDTAVKYLAGTLGFVNSSNEAQLVAGKAPAGNVVGVFKTEYDATDADNVETQVELWVGVSVILKNDATFPITFVGEDCFIFDNETVEAAGGTGTFKLGTAQELDPPEGGTGTVKVFIQPTS